MTEAENSERVAEQAGRYPIQQSAAFAGSTFALASLVDVLAHLGPTGLLVSGLAGYVAWRHGPELYAYVSERMREAFPPSTPEESPERAEQEPARTQSRSLLDRSIGHFPEGDQQQAPTPTTARAYHQVPQEDRWDERWYDEDEEEVTSPVSSSLFTFSQILDSGFVPSLQRIFLGRLPDGTDVCVAARDLCHVALAGNTGGGKGVLLRMIVSQLCATRVPVLLLNPHYMCYDHEYDEDWTPFESYLEQPPLACKSYEQIGFYLHWMAFTLLPRRIERCARGRRVGKPYFLVLDELPSIVAEIKEAPTCLAKILREGRKYGIFLISASQDFLVKTLAADGEGAIRKCYRTAVYVGGDSTTAKVLLNLPPSRIPENRLGKGTAMLRCAASRDVVLVDVPYVDNASLYRLLGPSTYQPSETAGEGQEDDVLASPVSMCPRATETTILPEMEALQLRCSLLPPAMAAQEEQEPDKGRIPLGKDVSVTREQFTLAVKLRKTRMSTGYRDLMPIFDLSEHHAKELNRRIREALGQTPESESE